MDIFANFIIWDDMLNLKLIDDFKFISKMEIGNSLMQDFSFLLTTYNIFDEVYFTIYHNFMKHLECWNINNF